MQSDRTEFLQGGLWEAPHCCPLQTKQWHQLLLLLWLLQISQQSLEEEPSTNGFLWGHTTYSINHRFLCYYTKKNPFPYMFCFVLFLRGFESLKNCRTGSDSCFLLPEKTHQYCIYLEKQTVSPCALSQITSWQAWSMKENSQE